jgi:hypothetical protein
MTTKLGRTAKVGQGFVNTRSRHYVAEIMPFDLSEKLALVALLTRTMPTIATRCRRGFAS